MASITLTIPDAKLSRVVDAIKGMYSIPQIPDPAFVGEPAGAPLINEFTDNQWAKERVRRFVVDTVRRWEVLEATETARIGIIKDDAIAS